LCFVEFEEDKKVLTLLCFLKLEKDRKEATKSKAKSFSNTEEKF
jgi:hypothetical protein